MSVGREAVAASGVSAVAHSNTHHSLKPTKSPLFIALLQISVPPHKSSIELRWINIVKYEWYFPEAGNTVQHTHIYNNIKSKT